MGCDIHPHVEIRINNKWNKVENDIFPLDEWTAEFYKNSNTNEPFYWRSYGLFGFLANVRNYSAVPYISNPKGLPKDSCNYCRDKEDNWDYHSSSYLTLKELLDFDYDKTFIDRRITRGNDGGATATNDELHLTNTITFREFLSELFFKHLDVMKTLGNPEDVRLVFWFDN